MKPSETTRHELPPGGTTLLGYVARRMHKTAWLAPIPEFLAQARSDTALEHVAVYAVTASTSYGRAYYQPKFDATGDAVSEADPATGAIVTARLDSRSPHDHISYEVAMPSGDTFKGSEEITGTTLGLRGLGMPAPSRYSFTSGEYQAELSGLITSELVVTFIRPTRIRAYGSLNFKDNLGHIGRLELTRRGDLSITINDQTRYYSLANLAIPETT